MYNTNYLQIGVRDYIHVMDLATGHVAALKSLFRKHQHLKASVTGMSLTFPTLHNYSLNITISSEYLQNNSAFKSHFAFFL